MSSVSTVTTKPWLQLKLELYFCKNRTTKRVGWVLEPKFCWVLEFQERRAKAGITYSKNPKLWGGKIAVSQQKTKGLPSPSLLLSGWCWGRGVESHVEYQLLMRVLSESDTGPKTKPEQTERFTNRKESVEPYKLHSLQKRGYLRVSGRMEGKLCYCVCAFTCARVFVCRGVESEKTAVLTKVWLIGWDSLMQQLFNLQPKLWVLNPGRCFHMPNNKSVIMTGASQWLSSALTATQKEQNTRGREKRCFIRWKDYGQLEKLLMNNFNPVHIWSYFAECSECSVL